MRRLEGKVALITGSAIGLGAAQVRLFSREGAKVAIADIEEAPAKRLEAEVIAAGGAAFYLELDVTSESAWAHAITAVLQRFHKLDVLVNNAGIYHRATVEETTVESWERVMEVNVKGAFLGIRAAIPVMRRNGGGAIVNISSVSGLIGGAHSTAYNASKGALRLLTKSTAVQYAADGIRCNSVHPAPIETGMLDTVFPDEESRRARLAEIPMARFGTPDDVAYGVLYLASDEASFVTGSELVIDGGLTAR